MRIWYRRLEREMEESGTRVNLLRLISKEGGFQIGMYQSRMERLPLFSRSLRNLGRVIILIKDSNSDAPGL